jgi:hypothetical protein
MEREMTELAGELAEKTFEIVNESLELWPGSLEKELFIRVELPWKEQVGAPN